MDIKSLGAPQLGELKSRENPKVNNEVKQGGKANTDAPATKSGDSVKLSDQAQSLRQIEKDVANLPEVNSERVAAIKQQLEEGSYQINSRSVAEKLLGFEQDF